MYVVDKDETGQRTDNTSYKIEKEKKIQQYNNGYGTRLVVRGKTLPTVSVK